jgi:hypothetical protein
VEVGAELLGQRGVGRIADEDVPKAERVVVGVRPDELLADEARKELVEIAAYVVGNELGDGRGVEHLTLDRPAAEDDPLAVGSALSRACSSA